MGVFEKANAAHLTPELIKRMLDHIDHMPPDQRRDSTGRGIGLIQFLKEHQLVDDRQEFACAEILISFEFRMEALMRLRKRGECRAWTLSVGTDRNDPDLIHEVLIDAAAAEPLVERNNRPAFNAASFFKRVMELVETKGRA